MEDPRVDATDEGAVLWLRVQPRARRSAVLSVLGDELKVAVRAPPVDGAANKAVIAFVAELTGARRRSVRLLSGQSGRSKRVVVEGLSREAVLDRVRAALCAL